MFELLYIILFENQDIKYIFVEENYKINYLFIIVICRFKFKKFKDNYNNYVCV